MRGEVSRDVSPFWNSGLCWGVRQAWSGCEGYFSLGGPYPHPSTALLNTQFFQGVDDGASGEAIIGSQAEISKTPPHQNLFHQQA